MSIRNLALIFTLFFATASLFAQAPPCRPGTMAAVVGTSCSVGPLTFVFANNFSGGQTTPAAIGFFPVVSGSQVGFKLVLNFADAPLLTSNGAAHFLQFGYAVQAAAQNEVLAETLSMEASAEAPAGGFAFVQAADFQTFPNQSFTIVPSPTIDFENGVLGLDQLSQSVLLEVPGIQSTGDFLGIQTTEIEDFVGPGSTTSLTSATFLYTTGPRLPIPPAAPLNFKIIDLPNVPGTFVSSIANSGRTVGSISDALGNFHGYVAEADGVTFTTFDFPGATSTFGATLNARGDVVGTYTDASGQNHGFLFSNGDFTTIDVPDARFTDAIGINDKGQIVGEYESQDGGFHGFLFENGTFTTIDHGPGTGIFASTGAFGINNAGQIVGFFFDPNTFRAFSQKGDKFEAEDVPGQGDTTNENVNNPGDTVGIFNDINLVQHGYLLSKGSFFTVDVPEAVVSFPLGINASGTIVGQFTGTDGISHSYLATPDSGNNSGPHNSPVQHVVPTENCNSEAWQLKHAERHHLTACRVSK